MIQRYFESYIAALTAALGGLDWRGADRVIDILLEARDNDRQIFLIGNGGSASAASHFACDLSKGTADDRDPGFRRFRALSLTDNVAIITAIGNDLSYEDVFVEQLKTFLNPGDVVIAITASGNSPNVLRALEYAGSRGAVRIGLLGFGGGRARDLVDAAIVVPSRNYGIAEDFHLILDHILTQALRRHLAGPPRAVAFLDRDGVINEPVGEHQHVTGWDQFRFRDGAFELLAAIHGAGYRLVVLANQQGVGKDIVTEADLAEIHAKMVEQLGRRQIPVDGVFTCPHRAEEACSCRKPKPGLIHRAVTELGYGIDFDRSFVLGDSITDIEAGQAAGLRTVLLGERVPADDRGVRPDLVIETRDAVGQLRAFL